MAFLPTVFTLFLKFHEGFVIKVSIYTLSQHDPVLLHKHPPGLINKQIKTLSSLSASTTGKGESL